MEEAGLSLLPRSPSGLFWRALSLPYRSSESAPEAAAVAGPLAASSLALGRPSRASLDALGPSCSLGAPAQAQSRHARSSSEDAESLVLAAPQEACADADVVALPHAQRPPRPPSAQRRPLNARGAEAALRSTNPIRKVVDAIGDVPDVPDKPLISLAIGDPTAYGLRAPAAAAEALATAASSGLFDGYAHSSGLSACRAAVAAHHALRLPATSSGAPALTANDVLMTHGASQALSLALGAIANPHANVLIPRPGFPLYQTLCEYYGIEYRQYDLLPQQGWEVDLAHVSSLGDANTAAIVVCNPSNPTGSVFTPHHLRAIVATARSLGCFLIADEVYADIVWADGASFVPMAALSDDVPVLSIGALSKRWLVPGWRCGWLLVHDRKHQLAKAGIVEALNRLVQITIGPTVPVQASVPHLLANTPRAWHDQVCAGYRAAAELCCARAAAAPGLQVDTRPQGAMYLLVRIQLADFDSPCDSSDVAWAAELQREEAVLLLPGTAFGAPGRVRLVLCAPEGVLSGAWDRIHAFCVRHYVGPPMRGMALSDL